jgi:hypothetical protein
MLLSKAVTDSDSSASVALIGLSSSIVVRLFATLAFLCAIGGATYAMRLFADFRSLGACAADAVSSSSASPSYALTFVLSGQIYSRERAQ